MLVDLRPLPTDSVKSVTYRITILQRIGPESIFFHDFSASSSTKHVSIQSPTNDISPMSVISGVKSSPKRGGSGLRKGEKPPRFGVKTEQEPELSTVSCKRRSKQKVPH